MRTVEFYAAHEALLLDYERPLTRIDSRSGRLYDTSGHFVWVGERTRQLDGAHIDFVSRISNPIGVKLGPKADIDEVLRLIDKVDPEPHPGTPHLHHPDGRRHDPRRPAGPRRQGDRVRRDGDVDLRPHARQHVRGPSGYKTRDFEDIVEEVRGFFEVHQSLGTIPGGIHVELTGNDVTECLGGAEKIIDSDLEKRYESRVRPAPEPPAVARARVPRRRDARPGLTVVGGHEPLSGRTCSATP